MLTALKIAGFVLLGMIGFIVLIAALILIAPFRYKISGDKPEKTEDGYASFVIRWLFPLLHVSVIYDKDIETMKGDLDFAISVGNVKSLDLEKFVDDSYLKMAYEELGIEYEGN